MAHLGYQHHGWSEHFDQHLRSPNFRRYWNYYGRVMEWKSRHRIAWWKANFAAEKFENEALRYKLRSQPPHGFLQEGIINPIDCTQCEDNWDYLKPTDVPQKHCSGTARMPEVHIGEDFDNGDHEDELLFEMEITDDMLAFLEKSDQHRRQLRAERQAAQKEAKKSENNEDDVSCGPPDEQPGARRTTEMKELYGRRAATIHGMETALQLTFHRNCDYHQPKLWPNIPIKLQFS